MYYPSNARKIRHVMDIFTDKTELPIKLEDEWVGLKVTARNSLPNREIAFLEENGNNLISSFILNLEPINSFPSVPKSFAKKFDWNSIPGNDNNKLLNFLKSEIDLNQLENANILKNNEGTSIHISTEEKTVEIALDVKNGIAILKISDGRIYTLQIKRENGKLNIYYYNNDLKHIKLEIEYILTNTKIERITQGGLIDKIINIITAKRKATAKVSGLIQPEIYMTIPPGWRISGKKEGHSVGMKRIFQNERNNGIIDLSESQKICELKFDKPFIKVDNNERRTYNYLINEADYTKLMNEIENSDSSVSFEFTYFSQLSSLIVMIAMIPYIVFIPISIYILHYVWLSLTQKSPFNFESNFAISYLIIVLSFSYFYYSLIKGDVHIPYKKNYIPVFILTILIIMIILFKDFLF